MATGLPRSGAGTPKPCTRKSWKATYRRALSTRGTSPTGSARGRQPGEIKQALSDNKSLAEAFDRMAGHLDANGVDIAKDNVQLGMPLKFDPRTERFVDNAQANELVTRKYRQPFVVPTEV